MPREEIFLTSKIWPPEYGEGKTLPAVDEMLKRLGTDYIDLLLLHQPFGDALGAWKELEKAVELGKVKNIGISNFEDYKFDDIIANAKILPAVHRMECHPYRQNNAMREKMVEYGIKVMCWYPLGGRGEGGTNAILNDPVIQKIAEVYGKLSGQRKPYLYKRRAVRPAGTEKDTISRKSAPEGGGNRKTAAAKAFRACR